MKKFCFLYFILLSLSISAQSPLALFSNQLANMPEPVSNNAVVGGWANDTAYVYSFGGIDSTKLWSGIHLRSFRYNTNTDIWDTIPSLPDTLGKIAAGASLIDSIIYIIGGYHVYSNGNEVSSAKVHRYNPKTNSYLSDGMDIPVAIDDHVQAVWNDSLIYVITGWSNTGNVPDVQIYDPTNNNWLVGTPTPNNSTYTAFGASGTIIDNTIYYHGGAAYGFNFPGQSHIRIGQINPSNPTQITWSTQTTNFITYRAGCFATLYGPIWIGGSEITYNYNGIAYNGSGGVSNKSSVLTYDSSMDSILNTNMLYPLDLRGVASPNAPYSFIAGGMETNQKVSAKTYRLDIAEFIGVEKEKKSFFKTYPNPTSSEVNLLFDKIEPKIIQLIDVIGNEVLTQKNNSNNIQLNLSEYTKGIYFVKVTTKEGSVTQKIIVQ